MKKKIISSGPFLKVPWLQRSVFKIIRKDKPCLPFYFTPLSETTSIDHHPFHFEVFPGVNVTVIFHAIVYCLLFCLP